MMKTLIINNYDSFTYNLFQMIAEINEEEPLVIYNDELSFSEIQRLEFDNIVLSPGPGTPICTRDFGVCRQVLLEAKHPLLGVCLGHQGIWHAFGGEVHHAPEPMHGRASPVIHQDNELFFNIPSGFQAMRYHSLIASEKKIPPHIEVTARTKEGLIMALRHQKRPIWGVQFHPESIGTEYGYQLLKNFKIISQQYCQRHLPKKKPAKHIASPKPHFEKVKPKPVISSSTYRVLLEELDEFYEPAEVYKHLFQTEEYSIWLDSSSIIENFSRFSFMGSLGGSLSYRVQYSLVNKEITVHKADGVSCIQHTSIFDFIQQELKKFAVVTPDLPFEFNGGFAGYLGYELKAETAKVTNRHASTIPDAMFLFLDRIIAFDHLEKKSYLLALTPVDTPYEAQQWIMKVKQTLKTYVNQSIERKNSSLQTKKEKFEPQWSRDRKTYLKDIEQCLHHLRQGESYQVCLTNHIHYHAKIEPYQYYSMLRQINPAPYAAFLNFKEFSVASASIERYLKISGTGQVETKPIKGTVARGQTNQEDEALKFKLMEEEKFRSENLIIVDLLRNDLGTTCKIGSVHVPCSMQVESYATVHQLVSTIRGALKPQTDAVDCVKATFPGGSMTGAPKIRTLNIIDSLEHEARGIYSGTIGYFALNGAADLNIVIRTAVITPNSLHIGIGGAITSLSIPEEEYQEILLKAQSLQRALELYGEK